MAALTFFIGTITLGSWQIFEKQKILDSWRQPLKSYVIMMGGIGGYTILIFTSFKLIPAFEANVLNYLWPIFLTVLTVLMRGKKLDMMTLSGIFLGFLGVIFLFYERLDNFALEFNIGYVLALMAALLWAIYSTLTQRLSFSAGMMVPIFFALCILFFFLHLSFEETIWPQGLEWIFIGFLGFFRISYVFWDYAMKKGNVSLLASLAYFVPLISAILFIIFGRLPATPLIAFAGQRWSQKIGHVAKVEF